jgi:integrase
MSVIETGSGKYQARVFNRYTGRRITQTFENKGAAWSWHDRVKEEIDRGGAHVPMANTAPPPITLGALWREFLAAGRDGVARAKGGALYKPSVISQYQSAIGYALHWLDGSRPVAQLTRKDVQDMIDWMVAGGYAPSTVRNAATALRATLRWAVRQEYIEVSPARDLELPSGEVARDKIVGVATAQQLCGRLWDANASLGALWATAFFCGLRRSELMALRRCDVDLRSGRITVVQSYDPRTQTFGKPKSKAGERTVGIPDVVFRYLSPWWLQCSSEPDFLLFGNNGKPFHAGQRAKHARSILGEDYISLHEARHTYASLLIAAGVNIKTISAWMGHASVAITLDRYGHLMPEAADVALGQLNRYLEGS